MNPPGAIRAIPRSVLNGATRGMALVVTDENGLGLKAAPVPGSTGYNPRVKTGSAGPFSITSGQQAVFMGRNTTSTVTFPSTATYTSAELVSLVNGLGVSGLFAKVRDDGYVEFIKTDESGDPSSSVFVDYSTDATALGLTIGSISFGSGGTPGSFLTGVISSSPANGEVLKIRVDGSVDITATFTGAENTASAVASLISSSPSAGQYLLVSVEGSAVRVMRKSAGVSASLIISETTTAESALGLTPDDAVAYSGTDGAFDSESGGGSNSLSGIPIPMVAGVFPVTTGNYSDNVIGAIELNGDYLPGSFRIDITAGLLTGGATSVDVEFYNLTDTTQIGTTNHSPGSGVNSNSIDGITAASGTKTYLIRAKRNGGAGTAYVTWVTINFN